MAVTVLGSTLGLCAVSSPSNLRRGTSAAKYPLTSIKSATSTTPPSRGVRRRWKNNDENGTTVAKVVENPYSKVDAARPDLRKNLSDFLEEARDFVGDGGGPPRWFSPLECSAQAPGSPLLLFLPDGIPTSLEKIFGLKQGEALIVMLDALSNEFSVQRMGGGMLRDIFAVLANIPTLSRMFPKDTLLWKFQMLKSVVASVNSHIYSVRAETLILPSGRNQWLLNDEDIDRYSSTLPKCIVRKLDDNGQFPLLEDSVDLATIIKFTCFYRRGKSHDYISDYILPTLFELKQQFDDHRFLMDAISPVMLSTLEDGTVVRSLEGLPSEGPVVYVGYHMILGFELARMVGLLLKERNIHMRDLTHPMVFMYIQDSIVEPKTFDKYKLMGGVPVSNMNFYKLLREKSHVLLYPGGVREALHRKGEEYKLFWPEQSEFVRVASKFGAKIVPFGVVGEDDIFNEHPYPEGFNGKSNKGRWQHKGRRRSELRNQDCYIPGLVPKVPGRFYYYFGKPIDLAGKEKELKDKEKVQEVYYLMHFLFNNEKRE